MTVAEINAIGGWLLALVIVIGFIFLIWWTIK